MESLSPHWKIKTSGHSSWRLPLLACGVLSSILYFALNILAPLLYSGYNAASQTVSELSAIDAPTRPLWVAGVMLYTLLVMGFARGVWLSAGSNRPLRVVSVLLFVEILIGIFWPPMHQREILAAGGKSISDTFHIIFTVVTVPLMMLAIAIGAAAFGKLFRWYSIITLVLMMGFGILSGLESPAMVANLPTPWLGIWERICIGVYIIWVAVLALALLRSPYNEKPVSGARNPSKLHSGKASRKQVLQH